MKLGLETIAGIRKDSPPTASLIESWQATITGGWSIDHRPDGTHGPIHERGRTTAVGDWVNVPFQTSPFTADGGAAWTMTKAAYQFVRYMLAGTTLTIAWYFEGSTVATATPTQLKMRLPNNYLPARQLFGPMLYDDNGTLGTGMVQAVANRPDLIFTTNMRGSVVWSISTNLSIVGQFACEINP
mgnify:CR=1 FL=1